jgi:hypothetical protein
MDMLDDQPARVTGAAGGKGTAIAERPTGNEVHVATFLQATKAGEFDSLAT